MGTPSAEVSVAGQATAGRPEGLPHQEPPSPPAQKAEQCRTALGRRPQRPYVSRPQGPQGPQRRWAAVRSNRRAGPPSVTSLLAHSSGHAAAAPLPYLCRRAAGPEI
ncbi:hypothetical protein NDU88_005377 [Pleurodeles waltl]|uniref:Uncharacterized protein n=1 Tax=Pleurodeles waltl TaxID=8319 RepID=A0AAV7WYL7_PLEWA|nr:hypothetical protein NDU88_005377 [Pleurodeles waltl]